MRTATPRIPRPDLQSKEGRIKKDRRGGGGRNKMKEEEREKEREGRED